jgi:hypothetical protein
MDDNRVLKLVEQIEAVISHDEIDTAMFALLQVAFQSAVMYKFARGEGGADAVREFMIECFDKFAECHVFPEPTQADVDALEEVINKKIN